MDRAELAPEYREQIWQLGHEVVAVRPPHPDGARCVELEPRSMDGRYLPLGAILLSCSVMSDAPISAAPRPGSRSR